MRLTHLLTKTRAAAARAPPAGPPCRAPRARRAAALMAYREPRGAPEPAGAARAPQQRQPPRASSRRRMTNDDVMSRMLTMLGGVESGCYTGYAGQWITWEVAPPGGVGAEGGPELKLVDEALNIRLWRDEGGGCIEQANLYQAPDKMAGSTCTRFAPYLRADATKPGSVRPDGYGLRSWTFDANSELASASGRSWLDGSGRVPSHRSMRVLTVPREGTAIVNGALPPEFQAGKGDIWVLEFVMGEPGHPERRWATMNWYEDGLLAVNRAINEDRVQLPADLASYTIKPEAFLARMAPRRDPAAVVGGAGVDAYVSALQGGGGGGRGGDDWGDGTEGAVSGLGAALSAAGAGAGGQLRGSFRHFVWDEAMALVEEEGEGCEWGASRGGPGPVLEQVYPDCSYCRQPLDLRALAEAGEPRATFEAGVVTRDGGIARWLLTYSLQGRRLVESAVYERYTLPAEPWGA